MTDRPARPDGEGDRATYEGRLGLVQLGPGLLSRHPSQHVDQPGHALQPGQCDVIDPDAEPGSPRTGRPTRARRRCGDSAAVCCRRQRSPSGCAATRRHPPAHGRCRCAPPAGRWRRLAAAVVTDQRQVGRSVPARGCRAASHAGNSDRQRWDLQAVDWNDLGRQQPATMITARSASTQCPRAGTSGRRGCAGRVRDRQVGR